MLVGDAQLRTQERDYASHQGTRTQAREPARATPARRPLRVLVRVPVVYWYAEQYTILRVGHKFCLTTATIARKETYENKTCYRAFLGGHYGWGIIYHVTEVCTFRIRETAAI